MTDRYLVEEHLRNMRAENAHNEKYELEKERYKEVVETESGFIITSTNYTKNRVDIYELLGRSRDD